MRFQQYLANSEKQYHLRLKTLVPLDDAAMDRIELAVAKYLPIAFSRPKKTIIQRQPLEFPNVQNAEIYMVDMTFGLPAPPAVIRDDIRKSLQAADESVFVRTQAEPGEIEMARMNALADIEAEAAKKGLTPIAELDDPDYNEVATDQAAMFGNTYNANFLSYLGVVQKERDKQIHKVANAPFVWLDLADRKNSENDQDTADYNAEIPLAPKITPQGDGKVLSRHPLGHFTVAADGEVRKLFQDAKGNRIVLARKLNAGASE